MTKQIFVNLPVKDLNKTKEFFTELGFTFNPQFRKICDAKKNTEVLVALSAQSRKEVDEMIDRAMAAGGSEYRKAQDYGWMYGRSFEDIDGHIWEIFYMDESKMTEEMKGRK